jgi:hypothetical protein
MHVDVERAGEQRGGSSNSSRRRKEEEKEEEKEAGTDMCVCACTPTEERPRERDRDPAAPDHEDGRPVRVRQGKNQQQGRENTQDATRSIALVFLPLLFFLPASLSWSAVPLYTLSISSHPMRSLLYKKAKNKQFTIVIHTYIVQ